MARMKHIKEPESKARLKRDRAFREALAKEYGVEKPPRSFQRMMAKTLEELPDAMPVRPRPVLTFVRWTATVAAALAVTFAALLGVNTTYPQLTEALPGLGPVFTAINGERAETPQPEETPSPSPAPSPQPEFQPVTVLSKGDFPGVLVVDDAWCDGKAMVLDMSIAPHDELKEMLGLAQADPDRFFSLTPAYMWTPEDEYDADKVEYTGSVEALCGKEVVASSPAGDFYATFLPDGSGKLRVRWQTQLGNPPEGDSLDVSLYMPDILSTTNTGGDENHVSWSAGFQTNFTVPVSTEKNRQFKLQTTDNQAVLEAVDYTPSLVDVQVQVPFLGAVSDLIFADPEYEQAPLGSWAELTCMDDGYRYTLAQAYCAELAELSREEWPEELSELHLRYLFACQDGMDYPHPRDLKGPLLLTIYELPEENEHDGILRRVMAEFTIDLNTGRAYASENFRQEGRERMDVTKTASQRIAELMEGDVLPFVSMYESEQGVNPGYFSFDILQRADKEPHPLYVYGYINGEPQQMVEVPAEGDGDDGTNYFYRNQGDIAGDEYLVTHVMLAYPEWAYDENGNPLPFDRVEIVDAADGVVLTEDVEEWSQQARLTLLGNALSPADAEGGAESQPIPGTQIG